MNGLTIVRALLVSLAIAFVALAADTKPKPSPSEKARAALYKKRELEVINQPLDKAMELLSKQAGVTIEADVEAASVALLTRSVVASPTAGTLSLKSAGVTVKEALDRGLAPYSLTSVLVGDKVVITTADRVVLLTMRQRISVHFENVPFDKALRNLAEQTGVNIVLDPKFAKEATAGVTLKVHDVPVEAAVATLSSAGGWSSVRLSNVLFVTNTDKAKEMRAWAADLDRLHTPMTVPTIPGLTTPNYNFIGTPLSLLGAAGGGPVPPAPGGLGLGFGGGMLGVAGGFGGSVTPITPRR